MTADADFGALLALGNETRPPVVLLRSADHLTPDEQSTRVLSSLEHAQEELERGAVASVTPQRVRIRSLPMDAS